MAHSAESTDYWVGVGEEMPVSARSYGFTLLELVLSLSITSVLAIAVASSIFIATQSLPRSGDASDTALALSLLDDGLRTEVELATAILETTDNKIAYLVADRDGDEIEERIELSWTGVPGTPLARRVNGGPPVEVVSSVQNSNTTIISVAESVFVNTGSVTPASVEINGGFTHGGWSPIYADRRLGLRVMPALPADVTHWRLTGVDLYLRWPEADEGDLLEVRAGLPVTNINHAYAHSMKNLKNTDIVGSGQWVSIPLRSPWLPRTEPVIVALHNKVGSSTPSFRFKLGSMPTGLTWLAAAGSEWVNMAGFRYSAMARYETITYSSPTHERQVVRQIRWDLEFAPQVPSQSLTAHPVSLAEDQR